MSLVPMATYMLWWNKLTKGICVVKCWKEDKLCSCKFLVLTNLPWARTGAWLPQSSLWVKTSLPSVRAPPVTVWVKYGHEIIAEILTITYISRLPKNIYLCRECCKIAFLQCQHGVLPLIALGYCKTSERHSPVNHGAQTSDHAAIQQ